MSSGAFTAAAAQLKAEPLYLTALEGRFELGAGPDAITWLELAAAGNKSPRTAAGAVPFLQFARSCFTEKGWEDFRTAVRAHGITDHGELEELIGQALEVLVGHPTEPSSDSDSGSSPASPPSTEISSAEPPTAEASSA